MRIREANVLPETDKRKLGKEMDTNMRKLGALMHKISGMRGIHIRKVPTARWWAAPRGEKP